MIDFVRAKRLLYGLIIGGLLLFSACPDRPAGNSASNAGGVRNVAEDTAADPNNSAGKDKGATPGSGNKDQEGDAADFEGTAGVIDEKKEIKEAALLKKVRTAQHGGYDRLVFEFGGAELPSYHIEYIDKPVRQCGSGKPVELAGDGWLEIRFEPANAHTEDGKPSVGKRELKTGHKIVRELKLTCDFEAVVAWVAGVATPNRYRVLELRDPSRLVVDVRH